MCSSDLFPSHDMLITDLGGETVARDWEWLSEYLITFSHANDAPCFEIED